MNGILLIDKPAGMTSHTVVSKLRKKLGIKKIGHAGTLDPSATGLLIICIGYATKISAYVTDADKVYQTRFVLGKVTTTYDAEGDVVAEKNINHITQQNIIAALPRFIGTISQKPPIYSAIKVQGKKLYQYARSNTEVDIPTRTVTIHSIKLLSFDSPFATLEMSCTKGTYVRSLVHDLGQELGVGASVETIHRVESSPYSVKNGVSLSALLEMDLSDIKKRMIPVKEVLANQFKTISISDEEESNIRMGVEYSKNNIQNENFTPDSLFLFMSKKHGHEIAIAKWGEKDRISFLRIL